MTYAEKLKDPRWQKKRLKILEYAEWRCQICGAKNRTLHVHHSYYLKGKEPWQYPDGSLISTCDKCHEKLHPEKNREPLPSPPRIAPTEPVSQRSVKERFGSIFAALEAQERGEE